MTSRKFTDCFPEDGRVHSWTTYGTSFKSDTMAVQVCELCGVPVEVAHRVVHARNAHNIHDEPRVGDGRCPETWPDVTRTTRHRCALDAGHDGFHVALREVS